MTKDQYLEMMDQIGEEPDWEKCPNDWGDFPELILNIVNLFHSLGDRVYADIGYVGKDYTNLQFLFKKFGVEKHMEDYVFDLLLWLDGRAIEKSQQRIKAERDKANRKH